MDSIIPNFDLVRDQLLSKLIFLKGDIQAPDILNEFRRGYRFFVEAEPRISSGLVTQIGEADFFLCISTLNAYHFDLTSILNIYLAEKTSFHPFECYSIITAAHEAYKNALLWSNLQLDPSIKEMRPGDFYEQVKEKLKDPTFAKRKLYFLIKQLSNCLQLSIAIEGLPIIWRKTPSTALKNYRGTKLIQRFSDLVTIDKDHKNINLYYFTT